MTTADWDVTTDEGFAAFFTATFDAAYAYAASLCAHDRAGAEALVRLVYGFARGHARNGRVATLSAAAMHSAITNAWRDAQDNPDAPLPAGEPPRHHSEATPRPGLHEELFAELVGAAINPWAADPDATVAVADVAAAGRAPGGRRTPLHRVAAYAVLGGVILFVLAVTLRDSDATPPVITTVPTTAADSTTSTDAAATSTSVAPSSTATSTATSTAGAGATTPTGATGTTAQP